MAGSVRALFTNVSILTLGNAGLAGLVFLQGVVVARTLGPALLGVWAVIVSFTSITRSLLSFRTAEPLTRHLVEHKQERSVDELRLLLGSAIVADLATGIIAYIAIVAASYWVAHGVAGGTEAVNAYLVYGLTVILTCFDASWYCVTRDQRRITVLALLPMAMAAMRVLGIAILAYIDRLDLDAIAIWLVTTFILQALVKGADLNSQLVKAFGFPLRSISWTKVFRRNPHLEEFWAFMKSTYLASTFSSLAKNIDVMLLGVYRSDDEVGLFRLAKGLVMFISNLATSFGSILYQDLNELVSQKNNKAIVRLLKYLSLIWIPAVLALAALAVLFGDVFIIWVYGENYTQAYSIFVVLVVFIALAMSIFWGQTLLLAQGEFRFNTRVIVIVSISAMIAMALVAPLGSIWLAWVVGIMWLTSYLALTAMSLVRLKV